MPVAVVLARLVEGYLVVGVVFALWFAARGAAQLDPLAGHGSKGFRVLLVPGAAVLWPYLLVRLARGGPRPPVERTAHRVNGARRP